MSKVLITGGCGFIGVNLSLYLLKRDYELYIYDNFSQRNDYTLKKACDRQNLPKPEIIEGNVNQTTKLQTAVSDIDFIIHLAAFTNVRISTENPSEDFQNNSRGTFNALEVARQSDSVSKFILASSNAAVGEVEGAVDEKCIPEPISPYGASKLHGEALANAFHESYNLGTTSLRFANAYGPYASHKDSVIPKFIRRAKNDQPLIIFGDGNQTRDFVHAKDIASAIYASLQNDKAEGEIYQVATGTETRIEDLAKQIRDIASERGKRVKLKYTEPRKGEIKFNYSCIKKIKAHLNWSPKHQLQEELGNIFDQV